MTAKYSGNEAGGLLPFAGGSQFAVEEFGGGAVGAGPIGSSRASREFRRE